MLLFPFSKMMHLKDTNINVLNSVGLMCTMKVPWPLCIYSLMDQTILTTLHNLSNKGFGNRLLSKSYFNKRFLF